jgi:hypothetical protein
LRTHRLAKLEIHSALRRSISKEVHLVSTSIDRYCAQTFMMFPLLDVPIEQRLRTIYLDHKRAFAHSIAIFLPKVADRSS